MPESRPANSRYLAVLIEGRARQPALVLNEERKQMVKIKRAYDPVTDQDGQRILVDRLWPRGVSKEKAGLDRWEKELAPSTELRKWFAHDTEKWVEFQQRYEKELLAHVDLLKHLAIEAHHGVITLVFAAKDEEHNEAVVLKACIERLGQ